MAKLQIRFRYISTVQEIMWAMAGNSMLNDSSIGCQVSRDSTEEMRMQER